MLPVLKSLARAIAVSVIVLCSATAALAQDALAVVDSYLAAWNAHDSATAAALLAENASYLDASVGTPLEGRDAIQKDLIDAYLNAVPDATWTRDADAVVMDNSVAFEWTFAGTNTGDFADGTKATGKSFSMRGMTLIRVDGDKIIYGADYYDALGFYKMLGLM